MIQMKVKAACEMSTAHGLPHIASNKPLFVRILWLLAFMIFAGLFIKGFIGLVNKLQSRQVTSSFAASSSQFQFPDVYVCFENPISAAYASTMNDSTASEVNARFNDALNVFEQIIRKMYRNDSGMTEDLIVSIINAEWKTIGGYTTPHSIPYTLLADALAHRAEQSVISSNIVSVDNEGFYSEKNLNFTIFYHPSYLRCFRWKMSSDLSPSEASQSSTSLSVSLFIDGNGTSMPSFTGRSTDSLVLFGLSGRREFSIPVSDWSLQTIDTSRPDRQSGVRVFLMPPGEYPSEFGSSLLLEPGRNYLIEVAMTEEVYNSDQFPCIDNPDQVQFVNPYDQTPYSHNYSYSYCYYYEYQSKFQAKYNLSFQEFSIPWALRGIKYLLNLTGEPNLLTAIGSLSKNNFDALARAACQDRKRCRNLIYDARMSSAEWPSSTSLSTYLSTVVANARDTAASRGLRVPALDALTNASTVTSPAIAAYAKANLLKLQIKPRRIMCDRVTFSMDYGLENFVADVGGIMGIYLGMSLLTFFELVDLLIGILSTKWDVKGGQQNRTGQVADAAGSNIVVSSAELHVQEI